MAIAEGKPSEIKNPDAVVKAFLFLNGFEWVKKADELLDKVNSAKVVRWKETIVPRIISDTKNQKEGKDFLDFSRVQYARRDFARLGFHSMPIEDSLTTKQNLHKKHKSKDEKNKHNVC